MLQNFSYILVTFTCSDLCKIFSHPSPPSLCHFGFHKIQVHFLSAKKRGFLCEENFMWVQKNKNQSAEQEKKIIKILWWLIRFYSQVLVVTGEWSVEREHKTKWEKGKIHNYERNKKGRKMPAQRFTRRDYSSVEKKVWEAIRIKRFCLTFN